MANVIARPIVVDTPGAALVFADKIRVIYVKWVSPSATPGDRATILDANGKTLWTSVAPGANLDTGPQRIERWWNNGFSVPTLNSGTLFIDYA